MEDWLLTSKIQPETWKVAFNQSNLPLIIFTKKLSALPSSHEVKTWSSSRMALTLKIYEASIAHILVKLKMIFYFFIIFRQFLLTRACFCNSIFYSFRERGEKYPIQLQRSKKKITSLSLKTRLFYYFLLSNSLYHIITDL